ncbi:hypothetical protein [Variovorax sp. YR266]|uniref:hypothetical protein n=1 Tax=Variovorax sp. YR266 TaxID=1884386 RepID=UPI00115F8AE4|nr:hypothetical protein [Variovorax sp. YR266]
MNYPRRRPKSERELRQEELLTRLKQRGVPLPGVCLTQDAPLDEQVAIRELTLDAEGRVVSVSEFALSPKTGLGRTSTSDALKQELERLLAATSDEGIACGENGRRASREELEEWLLLIGLPVFSYRRG